MAYQNVKGGIILLMANYCFHCFRVNITYRGRASHAAAFPWEGINALDAAVMAYHGRMWEVGLSC